MKRIQAVCVLMLSVAADQAFAANYCTENRMSRYDIPVYLIDPGTEFVGIPVAEATHDLRVAIDNWRENSSAKFRPYYAGKVADRPLAANTVHVRATSNCDRCKNNACEVTTPVYVGLVPYRASTVYIEDPSCRSDDPYSRHSDALDSMDALLTHEIGHSWGLEDEYDDKCNGAWQSAMAENCPNGRFITRRDIGALASLYGTRQLVYKTKISTDGALSWQDGPPDIGMIRAVARQTSLGTLASSASREVLVHPFFGYTSLSYPYPYTFAESGNTGSYFGASVPWVSTSGYSWDAGGAAMKSSTQYAIAYRTYEDEDDCRKGVVVSTYNGTTTVNREARETEPNTFFSMTEGASIAYDPVADVYVAAFTTDDYNLAFQLVDPQTGNRIGFQRFPSFESYSAPAIACNSATYGGEYNCMVAWRRRGELDPIRYVRAKFSRTDTTFADFVQVASPTASELTVETFQPPSLTHYPSATTPFILGVKEGDTYSTWRYSSSSGTFTGKRTAIGLNGGTMLSGALGIQSGRIILRYAEF